MDVKNFSKEVAGIMPHIHVSIVKNLPSELVKGKISFAQMVILDILRLSSESKMSDISRALGVTKSAVTGLTDRLIKLGLIVRSRSRIDRRVVKVRLTSRGMDVSRRIMERKYKIIEKLFANISDRERSLYLDILRKVRENIPIQKG